jgi:hypothetical protein
MVNGVLVNGQWSMVKIRPTSFLPTEIFSLQFNKSFQIAILHSPLPIHLRMASPFSVPSIWMVYCLILLDLMPICLLLPVIWAATSPSRCLPQILLSSIANYLPPLFYRPLFQSFHTIQSPCLAKLLLANEN